VPAHIKGDDLVELRELREQRGQLIKQARDISERAEKDNRDLTTEERTNYDKAMADAGQLKDRVKRAEDQIELDREGAAVEARRHPEEEGKKPLSAEELRAHTTEFRSLWVRDRYQGIQLSASGRQIESLCKSERKRMDKLESSLREAPAYRAWLKALAFGVQELSGDERRDLLMGADPAGGFTVPPEQFQATLIRKIDDYVYLRALATKVVVTKAQDLGVPTLEDNPADADWTSELATGTSDTAMDFGKRAFAPHPLAKQIKVSKKLLRASVLDIEALIADRFAYKFGITEEKAFLLGTGAQQPLGVFVASANGISTARDVVSSNTTTQIVADAIQDTKYALKAPYRRGAVWLFHRNGIAMVSKLKDGMGRYMWEAGLTAGTPDRILNSPVYESEYVPSTFTTGQYVGILGDFSRYWIADSLDMTVQRLVELYAASNQEGFIMRQELDGMPVLEEAFARVTLA
jgi:HK97 family phage major capsid protein